MLVVGAQLVANLQEAFNSVNNNIGMKAAITNLEQELPSRGKGETEGLSAPSSQVQDQVGR